MGWLVVGLLLIFVLGTIAHFRDKSKRPGRHKVKDVELYDRVERECMQSDQQRGEFEVNLNELSDLNWLEIGSHEFTQDQFSAIVKWRNQDTQCIYKIIATAGDTENSITKQSKKVIVPLKT